MKFNLRKFRTIIIISLLLSISGLFTASFQDNISRANSFLSSIIVSLPHHLDFGLVFPGEQLERTFTVSYSDSGDGDGSYTIVEKRKPLPYAEVPEGYVGSISDYCQEEENFDDYARCYKTLCPYMIEYSEEVGENDVVGDASVGPDDPSDTWTIALSVPAIMGNVAQDHTGGIVTENGIYGCDLSFNEEGKCKNDVDVVLITDRSGSMGILYEDPSRLSKAKEAAISFLGNMVSNDQSSSVSYATTATTDKGLDNIHLIINGPSSTEKAIDDLSASGATNIGHAIELSNQALDLSTNMQSVKAAILLTDGLANKYYSDAYIDGTCIYDPIRSQYLCGKGYGEEANAIIYAESMAVIAAGKNYKIYTIGLGDNINEIMLQGIATTTGAKYYPAPSGSDLEDIYSEISQELCQ